MTTTLEEKIEATEKELKALIAGGGIGVRNIWFGDINPADTQPPAVHLMLVSADQNDLQVTQTASRLGWDLTYEVSCLYGGSEGNQTVTYARKFVNSVYNLLQSQHTPSERLNDEVFYLNCDSIEYGFVALDLPEPVLLNGGLIRMTIQVFEDR